MENFFYSDVGIRLPLYAVLGLATEVLFTGIADLVAPNFLQSWRAKNLREVPPSSKRDPRAMGYTFLWMIPIYMLLVFVEPLSQLMTGWPWIFRGLIYLGVFWILEYASGALIKKITGYCPWDYSYSRFSVNGHIRWDYAPLWFSFSLVVEFMSKKFVLLTPAIKAILS